jgi:STE24 endopeptidase
MNHTLLVGFLAALVLWETVTLYLLWRQMRFVRRHRDRVPADFAGQVSLAEHQKAADYTVAKARLQIAQSLVACAVRFVIVLGGLDLISRALAPIFAPR